MHLRTLLVSATAGALATGAGFAALPAAHAGTPPDPILAGTIVAWGDSSVGAATTVPGDLTAPVVDASANSASTAVVTADGKLRIWGSPTSAQETNAPTDVTDAAAVVLDPQLPDALLLHQDGSLTSWGAPTAPNLQSDAPAKAKAVDLSNGTAYAITEAGKLVTWGATPTEGTVADIPDRVSSLTDLVDVAVGSAGGLVLRANGDAVAWGGFAPGDPFNTLPTDLGEHKVVQIAAGGFADGLVLNDGTIRVWGFLSPPAQREFPGKTVKALTVGPNAAAILEDASGHRSVELWGTGTYAPSVTATDKAAALDGKPVASIAMSDNHAVAIVTSFREITKPVITGTPAVGQTLTATPATFSMTPTATPTGQWYATTDGVTTAIEGADQPTLTVTAALVGSTLSYLATATHGDDTATSASAPTAVVVAQSTSTVAVSVAPATGAFHSARTVTATVTKTGGTATGSVAFKVDSTTVTKPLTAGKAAWALPATLAVGRHAITATYSGDATTLGSSSVTAATVTKVTSKVVSIKAKAKKKTKKLAKQVTITATIRGAAQVSPSGKVTLLLKGKTKKKVTATVNAQGIAKVKLKKIKRGKYTVSVTYAGNGNVAAATGKKKLKL